MSKKIITNSILFFILINFISIQKAVGNNEKLFFNEAKFEEIRQRIEKETYANRAYELLLESLKKTEHEDLWHLSNSVRDEAIFYRISKDEKYLQNTIKQIVDGFGLDKPDKKLFRDTTRVNTYYWSWIMYRGGLFFAYDLIKSHEKFKPYEALMNQRLDEIIVEGFRYKNDIKRLGNTQFWGITGLGIAGFLRGNKDAIDEAINGKFGFKAVLANFKEEGRFWPEPIRYSTKYVECCLLILAEASQLNKVENLYAYTAPNGASLSRMIESYVTVTKPDGSLIVNGDGSETIDFIDSKIKTSDRHLFNLEDNSRVAPKLEIHNYRLKNPTVAWFISQSPTRDAYDDVFWGYTSLYYGANISHAQTPNVQSVVNPEMGDALIKSIEGTSYWNSKTITVHFRNGASQQFHSHNDYFHFTLNAFGVNLFHDWFYKWDYLAPRASNGFRNKTPLSGSILNHNTVVVDFKEPDNSVIKHAQAKQELSGVEFSEIKKTGNLKVISAKGEIYKGVKQQRTFAVNKEYVIDIFNISSAAPHNYDYVIHTYGSAEYPDIKVWEPWSKINSEYKLDKIDQKSNAESNVWIASAQKSDVKGDIIVNFNYRENIGTFTTLLQEEGTQVISGSTPVKIEGVGWDESLKINGLPERKPMFIARRNTASTTYFALHQPYNMNDKRLSFKRYGDELIVSGELFTDTYNYKTGTYNRLKK